jgi:hypothetical protein
VKRNTLFGSQPATESLKVMNKHTIPIRFGELVNLKPFFTESLRRKRMVTQERLQEILDRTRPATLANPPDLRSATYLGGGHPDGGVEGEELRQIVILAQAGLAAMDAGFIVPEGEPT